MGEIQAAIRKLEKISEKYLEIRESVISIC
jgi:hypothetical protein